MKYLVLFKAIFVFLFYCYSQQPLKYFSLDFTQTIIKNKSKIIVEGTFYYHYLKNKMITKISKPFESVSIVNKDGIMKTYDVKENTVVEFSNNIVYSSERSYFWYFLNGKSEDFDFPSMGYIISKTEKKDNYLIYQYKPLLSGNNSVKMITLVKKENRVIYIEFSQNENKPHVKIYFSNYQKVNKFFIPMNITEISFGKRKDSIIVIKKYNNLKINDEMDENMLNFSIPENARQVEVRKK